MWPYPKVLAHRGGGTLAPENTIAALRCGLAYGYKAVEFDVMLSKDGIGVVMHDPDFGRTVAGEGNVARTPASDLVRKDAGAWFGPQFAGETVPLFTEYIDYCRSQGIWMNIEVKPVPGHEAGTGRWVAQKTRARFSQELRAGELSFENVTFRYPGSSVTALDHASLTIQAGTVVGIVGRSGSGKT
eukprot:gene32321-36488_t